MCAVSAQPAPKLPGILRRDQNSTAIHKEDVEQQRTCVLSFKSICTNLQKSDGFSERQSRTFGPPVRGWQDLVYFNYTFLGQTALLSPGPDNFLWLLLLSKIGSKIINCKVLHWVKNPKYSTLETSKSYWNALSQYCQNIYTVKHCTAIKDALLHSVRVCWVVKTRTLTSEQNEEVRIKHLYSLKYFTGIHWISVKLPGLKFQQNSILWLSAESFWSVLLTIVFNWIQWLIAPW